MTRQPPANTTIWDPFVRVFHWSLVGGFALAFASEDFLAIHIWAGYVVGALVLARIAWGFIGTPHARFSDFVRSPAAIKDYLRALLQGHPPRYLGHNPAGGAMILLLLASLCLTTLTGIGLYGGDQAAGPLAGLAHTRFGGEALEEVHEFFAHFTLLLVGVHVLGVLVASLLHGENLVRAMLTGRKSL